MTSFLPLDVQTWMFGESNPSNIVASAIKFASGKRVGTIYVYIVSSNTLHRSALLQLFAGLPVQVCTVKAQDFLKALRKGTKIYATVGVDRVAALAAARYLCPSAPGCMVLDGGTAFTYTTVKDGRICGGISLGIAAKIQYLQDLAGMDISDHAKVMEMISQVKEPFTWMSDKPDSQQEIVKTVLRETSLSLLGALQSFLDQNVTAPSTDLASLPVIVVCGGDGDSLIKLLQSNSSNSLAASGTFVPSMDQYAAHTIDEKKRYVVVKERNLIRFGLQSLLLSHTPESPSDTHKLRSELIGTRVLLRRPPEGRQVYGFIASVVSSGDAGSLKKDKFKVFTDRGREEIVDGIVAVYSEFFLRGIR